MRVPTAACLRMVGQRLARCARPVGTPVAARPRSAELSWRIASVPATRRGGRPASTGVQRQLRRLDQGGAVGLIGECLDLPRVAVDRCQACFVRIEPARQIGLHAALRAAPAHRPSRRARRSVPSIGCRPAASPPARRSVLRAAPGRAASRLARVWRPGAVPGRSPAPSVAPDRLLAAGVAVPGGKPALQARQSAAHRLARSQPAG